MFMIVADSAASGSGGDALISIVVASSLAILAWRRARALKRFGGSPEERHDVRLADLDARLTDLEQVQGRLLELEERVDFAERMLAQKREEKVLPR
jgi:hypothetical protein